MELNAGAKSAICRSNAVWVAAADDTKVIAFSDWGIMLDDRSPELGVYPEIQNNSKGNPIAGVENEETARPGSSDIGINYARDL